MAQDNSLEIEPANGGLKARAEFWRHVALWILAGSCGALLSWNVYVNARINDMREEQLIMRGRLTSAEADIAAISTVGVDDRFRRQDFVREAAIWDLKFQSIERRCEECCNRPRSNVR